MTERLPDLTPPAGGAAGARQRAKIAGHENVLIQIDGGDNVVIVARGDGALGPRDRTPGDGGRAAAGHQAPLLDVGRLRQVEPDRC
jgi:hypothetical protein